MDLDLHPADLRQVDPPLIGRDPVCLGLRVADALFGAFAFEAGIAGAFVKEVLIGLAQIDEGLLQHLGMGGFQPGVFCTSLHVWQLVG